MPVRLGNKLKGFLPLSNKNFDKAYLVTTLVFQQGFVRTLTGIPPLTTPKATIGKDLINYKIYGNTVQGGLPTEYQRVEYLQSSGTQYINTGIYLDFTKNIEIKSEFIKPATTGRVVIAGSYVNGNENHQALSLEVTYDRLVRVFMQRKAPAASVSLLSSQAIPINTKIKTSMQYSASNSTVYLTYEFNGDTYTDNLSNLDMVSSGVIARPLRLFLDYRADPSPIANSLKIGATSIAQNGTLNGNFIPCYRKSDNKPGMYDLVTKTFYTNAGTGEFTVGANVYPTPTAPIEIESVGDKTKNLLQNTATSETVAGITFTVNADGSVTANGTATAIVQTRVPIDTSKIHGDYYYCAVYQPQSGVDAYAWDATTAARLKKWDGTTSSAGSGGTTSGVLQEVQIPEGHEARINLRVASGTTVNNYTFYPMIVASTETDATWEPYGYQIPITSGTATTNITLAQPLRRIVAGSTTYTDYSDYASQKVYRQCGVKVLDGTEDWVLSSTNPKRFYLVLPANTYKREVFTPICTHFKGHASTTGTSGLSPNEISFYYNSATSPSQELYVYADIEVSTANDFKQWLAQQYANGTPVTIVYPLATATEESVSLPTLPTERGATTTVEVATEVVPSNVEIVYRGK